MTDSLFILAVLCAFVAGSEWLVHRTFLKHFGTALLVILVTAIAANIGLIPAGSTAENPVPVYDGIFGLLAPFAIFLLLLPVNLRDVLKAGVPMILLFVFGSLATAIGAFVGMWLINGPETFGELYRALGGVFTATYSGGGVNFNTLALHYDLVREGVLFGGTVVIDNIITALWMIVTLAIPRLVAPFWPVGRKGALADIRDADPGIEVDTESLHPIDVGLVLALGISAVWVSNLLADWLTPVPSVLILTVLALVLAQIPMISRLRGVRVIGMFSVYLFLAVIGAFCDIGAMMNLGQLGISLFVLASVVVLVNGLLTFGAARLFRLDPVMASVASQANVGGPPSALALARSLGREDLVLPAVLLGTLGYALGSFLGFWVAESWMTLLG